MWFYVNGRFVEEAEATIPITDHSFLYGDGCFEGIAVVRGRILYLEDHIRRLFRSARMLRIEIPLTPNQLCQAVLETASANSMDAADTAYLRPLVTRGAGPLGVKNTGQVGPPNVVIIPQLSDRAATYGDDTPVVSAAITRFVRAGSDVLDPGIKSNNYLTSILALLDAQDRRPDIDVAVLRDNAGFLAEGHAMNLFCVVDGVLYTPMASAALRGITRSRILDIASRLGYPTAQTNLSDYDLICADEAFVTSSMSGVTAIGSVDGRQMPTPIPGKVTQAIRTAYVDEAWQTATEIDHQEDRLQRDEGDS